MIVDATQMLELAALAALLVAAALLASAVPTLVLTLAPMPESMQALTLAKTKMNAG